MSGGLVRTVGLYMLSHGVAVISVRDLNARGDGTVARNVVARVITFVVWGLSWQQSPSCSGREQGLGGKCWRVTYKLGN
jgi:hypothetical protein